MPQVSASIWVGVEPADAFAVSQTTGRVRRGWDQFIRRQHSLDGATAPAVASAPGRVPASAWPW
ncbi:hypothetical protein [Serinicoccus marinus]|uniref:hypothetical protein n=1 Tax=Serinicoccus marinus TaxID=247333 RepID=UPI0003FC1A95